MKTLHIYLIFPHVYKIHVVAWHHSTTRQKIHTNIRVLAVKSVMSGPAAAAQPRGNCHSSPSCARQQTDAAPLQPAAR